MKHLRCTIIGAGVSGVLMAYKLQKHLDEYVEFRIFEKSPDLGGTWYENRYPGCACDVPSHVYQFSFAPNPDWSEFYASSTEIQNYLKNVAKRFDLERYIHYNCEVTSATWDKTKATWAVDVEGYGTVESEILINAGGILHHPQMPTISGLSSFEGPLLHTARWDSAIDLKGKRVAIIGAGASAVQLLPKIQPLCEDVDIYIRTPSWICPPAGQQASDNNNPKYSEDDKQGFRQDRDSYLEMRKGLESPFNSNFKAFIKGSLEQTGLRKKFEVRMKELIHDEYLQSKLIPTFEAGCRRINPGEGYLLALQEANVHPIFDPISEIVKEGVTVELENGSREIREVDVLIAATGFNTSFKPRFPIIGRDSMNLQDKWSSDPVSYLGTGVSGFPNYLMFLGPNTPISNGSLMADWLIFPKNKGPLEATSDYFIRILRKVIRERVRSFEIRQEVEQDFDCHTVELMKDMVWTGSCRSWCKLFNAPLLAVMVCVLLSYVRCIVKPTNGKVTALYPGSSLHYMQTLSENRWEDYIWTYQGRTRFEYWGAGLSWIEAPERDPLGIAEREAFAQTTSVPKKGADRSFYIWD
ncbi:hypothetical protein N7485_001260, partial [Penicillium canescens]